MADLRTAAQMALEALENCTSEHGHRCNRCDSEVDGGGRVAAALRAALEQPEPMCVGCEGKPTPQNSPCAVCGKIAQQEQEPVARMHEDGSGRVITQRTYAEAQRQGGAPWSSVKNYTILLYTHPSEPDPPPEPIHEDKIRAEFREMDRCCLPGEMTCEDWFTEGVRFAEKHHEIV